MADGLDTVARLAERHRQLERQRNEAITDAVTAGATLREVGRAAKLSHAAIARITARTKGASLTGD